MNRTDRLYALVEELRVVAPRPRSASWLAERFEVSVRTIERDIGALQQTGSPIWAEAGRTGGYCLDPAKTLPPVNLTPSEGVALALALERVSGTPFADDARSAYRKVISAMQSSDAALARDLASRVHLLGDVVDAPPVPRVIADALAAGRVLRLRYRDRDGAVTTRDVEPLGYLGKVDSWYLIGWCRLREGVRVFRTDRIMSSTITAETPARREFDAGELAIPYGDLQRLEID